MGELTVKMKVEFDNDTKEQIKAIVREVLEEEKKKDSGELAKMLSNKLKNISTTARF